MEDFEFLRNITIGQYLPGDSVIHRLDPRAKITALVLFIAAVTVSTSYTANILLLALTFGIVLLARIPVGYILSGLKPALPFILLLALLQLMFYGNQYVVPNMAPVTIFRWGPVHVTNGSIQLTIVAIMRLMQLMFLTSLLTNTTTTTELTHGIEDMLRPLSWVGLPGHELSLVATIALRFVPILAEQLEVIAKAQASRGADFGSKSKLQFVRTTRMVAVMVVPLFIDAFRRAEDLILAMEARCYVGGRHRSHYVELKLERRDWLAMALAAGLAVLFIVLRQRFPI